MGVRVVQSRVGKGMAGQDEVRSRSTGCVGTRESKRSNRLKQFFTSYHRINQIDVPFVLILDNVIQGLQQQGNIDIVAFTCIQKSRRSE